MCGRGVNHWGLVCQKCLFLVVCSNGRDRELNAATVGNGKILLVPTKKGYEEKVEIRIGHKNRQRSIATTIFTDVRLLKIEIFLGCEMVAIKIIKHLLIFLNFVLLVRDSMIKY